MDVKRMAWEARWGLDWRVLALVGGEGDKEINGCIYDIGPFTMRALGLTALLAPCMRARCMLAGGWTSVSKPPRKRTEQKTTSPQPEE